MKTKFIARYLIPGEGEECETSAHDSFGQAIEEVLDLAGIYNYHAVGDAVMNPIKVQVWECEPYGLESLFDIQEVLIQLTDWDAEENVLGGFKKFQHISGARPEDYTKLNNTLRYIIGEFLDKVTTSDRMRYDLVGGSFMEYTIEVGFVNRIRYWSILESVERKLTSTLVI